MNNAVIVVISGLVVALILLWMLVTLRGALRVRSDRADGGRSYLYWKLDPTASPPQAWLTWVPVFRGVLVMIIAVTGARQRVHDLQRDALVTTPV